MRDRATRALAIALATLLSAAALACAQSSSASRPPGELADVRAYLDNAAATGFSGVVLIARGDDSVLEEAYGFADAEHRVRMRTGHRFRLGSLTKPITASAVLALVDRGRLTLDERVCNLLRTCPRAWIDVTVRHLLTHTSGIRDHFGDLEAVPVDSTVRELTRMLRALPADESLLAAPGTQYAYSNFNYVLLGAVLESVAGAPWEDVLRRLVFEPLGLTTMAYDDVYAIVPDRARGYARDEQLGLRNIDYDDHAAYAAGGLLSTASDLFRWSRGMLAGRLFGEELVAASVTPYLGDYGYGWQVRRFFDRRIYNHTGGIDGFSTHLAHYPDDGVTIIVLSNIENDSAILRACDIARRLFRWRVPSAVPEHQLEPRERCGLEDAS